MIINDYKPMTLGVILDKTFRMSFTNLRKYIKILILYFFLVVLPSLILRFDFLNLFFHFNDANLIFNINNVLSILNLLIILIFGSISTGVIFDLFIKSYTGEVWIFKKSLKYVIGKFWIILYNKFLAFLILILGIISILGWIFFLPCLIFIFPAILFEDLKKAKPVSRSFKLIGYSFWPIFGTVLIFYLITLALMFIVSRSSLFASNMLSGILSNILGDKGNIIFYSISRIIFNVLPMLFRFFLDILICAYYVLIYFNQRIKFEDYGIEKLAENMAEKS